MKVESTALAGQRETICHEERERERERERESRYRPWIFFLVFSCCSRILVRWFRLHSCAFGVRLIFGAHPKTGASTLGHHHISVCNLRIVSSHPAANWISNLSRLLASAWCQREEHIPFLWFHICGEELRFPVFSSHHCHLPVTG